ncbi:MAG: KTSC domain-containing protein [Thermomicrobiales bacterium]|nr:MAG: KTSC domain-containing protein [Thermomicrobiales bacterium]
MKRTPVDSSMMYDVGYDPETMTLEIGYNSGTVYQYFDAE